MIKKRILLVAPYPITNPQHGGQKRAKALFDFYRSIFYDVKFVGVYHRGSYEEHGADDILLGDPAIIKQLDKNPNAGELVAGTAIDNDIHVRSHMAELLKDYKPDIVQIEQAYPYLGLRVLFRELQMRPKLIFSSHNVEYRMKAGILNSLGLQDTVVKPIVSQIKTLEEQFSKEADLVIAVSKQDAKAHKEMGAKRCVVVPNGISKSSPSKESLDHWKSFKSQHGIDVAATFIGSGHPPNWQGFLDVIGGDTTFIKAGVKILLGGGIADYFKTIYKPAGQHKKFWHGVVPLGLLSEDRLAGLLKMSDIILLPITTGGGSNLKTAEAILSGKKIVATTYAFRGFEKYANLPNVFLADNPDDFKKAIVSATVSGPVMLNPKQARLSATVEWRYCLNPLKPALKKLARASTRDRVKVTISQHTPRPAKAAVRKIRKL